MRSFNKGISRAEPQLNERSGTAVNNVTFCFAWDDINTLSIFKVFRCYNIYPAYISKKSFCHVNTVNCNKIFSEFCCFFFFFFFAVRFCLLVCYFFYHFVLLFLLVCSLVGWLCFVLLFGIFLIETANGHCFNFSWRKLQLCDFLKVSLDSLLKLNSSLLRIIADLRNVVTEIAHSF